jgi:predicted amidohydrolase
METHAMKVGFVQFRPALADRRDTIQEIQRLSKDFESADLVVLPELCNSGYNFISDEQARETAEEAATGPFVTFLHKLCRENNQHIVAGINEVDERTGNLYNSAVLIGPEGHFGTYRKLHLFMKEKDHFRTGNLGLPVFDLGAYKLGVLICFDWIFPETWRVLALRGADIVCHPSNLVLPGLAQRAVPVQALMNRIFIVTANRIGTEGDLTFTGLSIIADPEGNVLAQASQAETEVQIVDIDIAMARNKAVTPCNDVFEDRHPGEYRELVKPQIRTSNRDGDAG